jgi:hypothetical protein
MSARCVWSNRHDAGTRSITLQVDPHPSPEETVFVCPVHEAQLRRFVAYARRFGNLFLVLVAVTIVGIAVAAILEVPGGVGAGLVFFGVTILAFPFATPETVKKLGVRHAVWVARGIGAAVIGLGVLEVRGVF